MENYEHACFACIFPFRASFYAPLHHNGKGSISCRFNNNHNIITLEKMLFLCGENGHVFT